jgi:IS1 family transposase
MFGTDVDGYIDTSYVEMIHLTIRTSLVRFIRKRMNFSKTMKMHKKASDFFQSLYIFIKPHEYLKFRIGS